MIKIIYLLPYQDYNIFIGDVNDWTSFFVGNGGIYMSIGNALNELIFSFLVVFFNVLLMGAIINKFQIKSLINKCTMKTKAMIINYRQEVYNLKKGGKIYVDVFYKYKITVDDKEHFIESSIPHRYVIKGLVKDIISTDINSYIRKSIGDIETWMYNTKDVEKGYILEDVYLLKKEKRSNRIIVMTFVVLIMIILASYLF